jgi:hypothetical protein
MVKITKQGGGITYFNIYQKHNETKNISMHG